MRTVFLEKMTIPVKMNVVRVLITKLSRENAHIKKINLCMYAHSLCMHSITIHILFIVLFTLKVVKF